MRRRNAVVVLALLGVLTGCGSQPAPSTGTATDNFPFPGQSPPGPALPDGWRWESFAGVQVGIPGDWGWDNAAQRIYQWCIGRTDAERTPAVGRAGPASAVGCWQESDTSDPESLLENTGHIVGLFAAKDAPDGTSHQGDRTTVRLNGVEVHIITTPQLRERIAATVHTVEIDSHGCPASHAISDRPAYRPEPAEVTALEGVTVVAACKYELSPYADVAPLVSSLRLDGADAAAAIERIARAKPGGGPDDPECFEEYSYGDEVIVLRVGSAAGLSEIVLRYSGCGHHGFDDGTTVRSLTAAAVAPFVVHPNRVWDWDHHTMTSILDPNSKPVELPPYKR